MSQTLNRYLIKEIRDAMLGIVLILIVVVFSGLLTDVLNKITRGLFPPELILSQMALRVPRALNILLPLAGFLGVILAYTRLYRDSEMAVLRSSGFSELSLLRPVLLFALPLAFVLAMVSLNFAPTAQRVAVDQAEQANREVAVAGLEPGGFLQLPRSHLTVYAGDLEERKAFSDVLIVREQVEGELQIVRAESGSVSTPDRNSPTVLRLQNGQRIDVTLSDDAVERVAFGEAELALPESLQQSRGYQLEDLSNEELHSTREGRAEYRGRLSTPLMLILLMMLAPALARSAPRQVRYDRIVIGVMLYVVYSQSLELAKRLSASGRTPEWLGPWWVHAIFAIGVLFAYRVQIVGAWRAHQVRREIEQSVADQAK
jgi:lipopolysaccharide export system permease protein